MSGQDIGCRTALRSDALRNRQRIVGAARELFAVRGLDATLNDVARSAGVGVGTVYRRFATKDELLEAIFEDGIDQLVEIAKAALNVEDSWDGFVWFVERICELTGSDRGLGEMVCSKAYGGHRVDAARQRLNRRVSQIVDRAHDDGHIRPEIASSDLAVLNLLAGTIGEYAARIEPNLWRRYIGLLLDGMRSCGEQQRLPVDALGEAQMNRAMQDWRPAG